MGIAIRVEGGSGSIIREGLMKGIVMIVFQIVMMQIGIREVGLVHDSWLLMRILGVDDLWIDGSRPEARVLCEPVAIEEKRHLSTVAIKVHAWSRKNSV